MIKRNISWVGLNALSKLVNLTKQIEMIWCGSKEILI